MTRDELAAKLNGREYGSEISRLEEDYARANRLLVIFGYSDDVIELKGLISDEVEGFLGSTFTISQKNGKWKIGDRSEHGVTIKALWCPKDQPDDRQTSWLIKSNIPHATFDIMEDGELFCQGAVISEADLLPPVRVHEVNGGSVSMTITFSEVLTESEIEDFKRHIKSWGVYKK